MKDQSALVNKYSLVKGAARRARQLQSGAPPLSNSKSMKACRVAQDEIRQGFVTFVLPERIVEPTLDHPMLETL
jgi:DNA-directed RNA polymerase subunit omega